MIITGDIIVKRLSSKIEYRRDITRFGLNNIYPQDVEQILLRSSYLVGAVQGLTVFTHGEGFELNGDLVVNRHDQTLDEVLLATVKDFSVFKGFALHFNVNELLQITEITPVDFKTVRFGLPDKKGIHKDVKLNQNWEGEPNKTLTQTEIIWTWPLWQRRDMIDFETFEIEDDGGFIFYYTPKIDQYPLATFDPVLDASQTDGETQLYELRNIQNGYIGANIFKHAGKIQGEEERLKIEEDLRQLQGSQNANSIMIVETPPDFEGDIIESLAGNQNADLYDSTGDRIIARIMANYGQPYPIAGIQPPNGGIFNQEQMQDAHHNYNARTRIERTQISTAFNKFLEFWHAGPVDVGEIKELQFEGVTSEEETENETV